MIHLTVLLPAAVSSNLISRESGIPSSSLNRHELFTSQPTAHLIACINDTKQMNLNCLLCVRWAGCWPVVPQ